jgi:hypothetical protein
LGCSPDGLIGADKIVEIKCPFTAHEMNVTPETSSYIELDEQTGLYRHSPTHDYMYQVQGLLHITNRSVCDFVVFTISDLAIIEVKRDQEFIEQTAEHVEQT